MIRPPSISTLTATLFPYTTLFRSTCISVLSQICRRQLLAAGQDSRAAHHSRSLLWIDTQLALDDLRRFLGVVMPERDRSAFRLYIAGDQFRPRLGSSEERRVGNEGVSTCKSRGSAYH